MFILSLEDITSTILLVPSLFIISVSLGATKTAKVNPVKTLKSPEITELNEKNITLNKNAKKIFDLINKKKYKFSKQTKDNDELYGSIKPKEISKTIDESNKIQIKPSQIDLSKEINKIGTYEAKINLHAEIVATIHIEVVKQEEKN